MFNFFFRKPERPDALARTMHRAWWLNECWLSPPLPVPSQLRWTHQRITEKLQETRDKWENNKDPELLERIEYLESYKLDQWVIVDD